MSTSRRTLCLIALLLLTPIVVFGTQFGQIPFTQVIGTPSIVNDSNITLTLGGTPTDAVLKPFSLTLAWTGTLAVARGGTGSSIPATGLANLGGQPVDADLTAIAALSTVAFGRGTLELVDGPAFRTYIGAGTSNFDGTFTSLTGKPTTLVGYGVTDAQPLDSDLTSIAALATTSFGRGGLIQADAAAYRAYIGTEVPLTFSQSLVRAVNNVTLLNDSATPGNSKYYGTDSGGTRGYFALPGAGGGGTVTDFSAGDLSPLFTTTEATTTTTPALSFVLTNAGANTWFGNDSASPGAPAYKPLVALTEVDDTNVTLSLGGTPATSMNKAVSITAGWVGTLAVARGGTGAATVGANTWFGNDTVGTAAPGFKSLVALTKTDDTNVTLTLGGSPATSMNKAVSLALGWTGTLAVGRGGTGAATAPALSYFGNPTTSTAAPSFVATGGQTFTSSQVDQTGTAEQVHITYTVPANAPIAGATYRMSAWGNTDNSTTAITYTPTLRWGGVAGTILLTGPAFTSTTTAGTNRQWSMVALVQLRTIGASGAAWSNFDHIIEKTTSSTSVPNVLESNSGVSSVVVDTTTNKDLVLTWTMSVNTGAPHVRTYGGIVEVVRP